MTEDKPSPSIDLQPSDKVALVLHGIDTVWRAWQYQFDRSREFLVLLSALAGGMFALFTKGEIARAQAVIASCLGLALAAFWSWLNYRWAPVIWKLTDSMHAIAESFALSAAHPYLKGPFAGLQESVPEWARMDGPPRLQRSKFWWMQGTMGLSLIYATFYLALVVYFACVAWPIPQKP